MTKFSQKDSSAEGRKRAAPRKRKHKRYIKISYWDWPHEFACQMCGDYYRRGKSFHIVLDFPYGQFIFGKPLKRNGGELQLKDEFIHDYIRVCGCACRTCVLAITDRIDRHFESRVK